MTNNSKLAGMSPVCVINLEHRDDRRDHMVKSLSGYGVTNYKIFSAYDGSKLDGTYEMSKGEIGCAMSHLLAIKDWYETDTESPYLVIMEDDVDFSTVDLWNWSWLEFIQSISFDYELIHLAPSGSEIESPEDYRIIKFSKTDVPVWFTTSYLITRRGAEKVLNRNLKDGEIYFDFNNRNNIADYELIYGAVDLGYKIPLFAPKYDLGTDIEDHDQDYYYASFHGINRHTKKMLSGCTRPLSEILNPN